jgi:DNA-directed RNA polymerase subunit M/transcription elongation factor TFIIS
MEFCDNCFNFLFTKEVIDNNKKNIIYYCKKCNFKKTCNNYLIFKKTYKNIIKTSNDNNRIIVEDKTLPTIKIICNNCKKTNDNKYKISYYDNSYHKKIICINCYKDIK